MDIKHNVVAITGGAQGLGLAMANLLGGQGARLALLDINADTLEHAKQQLTEQGVEVRTYCLDITQEVQVEETFASIAQDFGQLNLLVNNAGLLRDGMLVKAKAGKVNKKMSLAEFQAVVDVNLTGTFLCGREAAVQMIETGSKGVIINISSVSRAGNIGQTNYAATKAAVVAMTSTWAKELARFDIRAAAIAPGVIATDMTASMKPEALARLEEMVPVGRLGQAQEVAKAVGFIMANDYFDGRVLELDGGIRL